MSERIASPGKTIEILQAHQFQFLKKYGQNFLIDLHVLDKITASAQIGPEDVCVEIGPGIGSLTQALAERAAKVIAVEIDSRLIPILNKNVEGYENVSILNEDFLKLDLAGYLAKEGIQGPIKVIANLPYYITTPVIMGLLEGAVPLHSITVMVQEEVARRMQAGPGTKDYGALSLAVQYYSKPEIVAFVPPNCFIPRPNVGSAVIRLERTAEPPAPVADVKLLFRVIRASFGQRRKTMLNSLSNSQELPFGKEQIRHALEDLGIDERIRGEALTLLQFIEVSNRLAKEA